MPSTVWRIKTRNSSSTFHFTCRGFTGLKRREGKKKKKVTKTNSTKDRSCSRARGGVWKSGTSRVFATQTVRECGTVDSSPHEFMNLLLACHYGCMLSRKAPKRVGRETVHGHEVVPRSDILHFCVFLAFLFWLHAHQCHFWP